MRAYEILVLVLTVLIILVVVPVSANENVKELRTLRGHSGSVWCLCMSPDGKILASGGVDKIINLWNIDTGEKLRTLDGNYGRVLRVAFSPDGKILASGSDTAATLWDVNTGTELRTLRGHSGRVHCVAFSPDGKILATGGEDKSIKLWDVNTGEELRTLNGHSSELIRVVFSPDGKILASGSFDNVVILWDINSGKELRALEGHTDAVPGIAFSPNGKILASGSGDKTIKLWDVDTGKELRTLEGHSSVVHCVAFSPDGKILASGSGDKTIKLWDVDTGHEICTLRGHEYDIYDIAFSPNGRILASASIDSTIKLWDLSNVTLEFTQQMNQGIDQFHVLNPQPTQFVSTNKSLSMNTEQSYSTEKTVVLDMCFLPTTQGWKYVSVGNSIPENSVFSIQNLDQGCILHQDSLGIGQANQGSNGYQINNVVDPSKPFILKARARILEEEGDTNKNHYGLCFAIGTGTEAFSIGIGPNTIQALDNANENRVLSTSVDNTKFHDYQLEGTPGVGYKLYVDSNLVATGTTKVMECDNRLYLGDSTGGTNAKADIASFEFTQGSCSIEGIWAWFSGQTVVVNKNGTLGAWTGPKLDVTANWMLINATRNLYVIQWNPYLNQTEGYVDTLVLSPDCMKLEGYSLIGTHVTGNKMTKPTDQSKNLPAGILLETIRVPSARSDPTFSTHVLEAGKHYVIGASGIFSFWGGRTDGADALYNYAMKNQERPLLIDDQSMYDIAEKNQYPSEYNTSVEYNSDHVYFTSIVGKGNLLKLQIWDPGIYTDNYGSLEVKIFAGY